MADQNSQSGHGQPGRNKGEPSIPDSAAASSTKKALKPTEVFEDPEQPETETDEGEQEEAPRSKPRAAGSSRFQTIFSVSLLVCLLGGFGVVVYQKYSDRIHKLAQQVKDEVQHQIAKRRSGKTSTAEESSEEKLTEKSTSGAPEEETIAEAPGKAKLDEDPPAITEPAASEDPFGKATEEVADQPKPGFSEKQSLASQAPPAKLEQSVETESPPEAQPGTIKAAPASVSQLKQPEPNDDPATLGTPQAEEPAEQLADAGAPKPSPGKKSAVKLEPPTSADAPQEQEMPPPVAPKEAPSPKPADMKPTAGEKPAEADEFGPFRPVETGSSEVKSQTRVQTKPPAETPDTEHEFSQTPKSPAPPTAETDFPDEAPPVRRVERLPPKRNSAPSSGDESLDSPPTSDVKGERVYTIQPHDTYWKISKQQYGTVRYFMALLRYNQKSVPDPQAMRPGTRILLPPKEVLEQRYPDLFKERKANPQAEQEETGPRFFMNAQGKPAYRVGPKDTLSTISDHYLGKATRWDEIYRLNQELLKDADSLRVGTVLQMPDGARPRQMAQEPQDFR